MPALFCFGGAHGRRNVSSRVLASADTPCYSPARKNKQAGQIPMKQHLRFGAYALVLLTALAGCNTAAGVTDGIGGVFTGMSDDIRGVRR